MLNVLHTVVINIITDLTLDYQARLLLNLMLDLLLLLVNVLQVLFNLYYFSVYNLVQSRHHFHLFYLSSHSRECADAHELSYQAEAFLELSRPMVIPISNGSGSCDNKVDRRSIDAVDR